MTRKIVPIFGLLIALIASGCASVQPGKRYEKANLEAMKSAYVVVAPDTDKKIGAHLQEALGTHGVKTTAGALADKPKDVDFYVTYMDHWRWDMAMYLLSLEVKFYENASGKMIGSGLYGLNGMHSFPDPKKTSFEVVDSIYKAK